MKRNAKAPWGQWLACACQVWLWTCISLCAEDLPQFREHVLTHELKFGYQLVAADLNGDGRRDVIAVDERATELAWYENQHPSWNRHVLAVNVPRPLNADCWDVDGDGVPEVVLAYRVEPSPERSVGNVDLLKSGRDVRQPWRAREIDRVPTAHRVRWIDPEGEGKKVKRRQNEKSHRYCDLDWPGLLGVQGRQTQRLRERLRRRPAS